MGAPDTDIFAVLYPNLQPLAVDLLIAVRWPRGEDGPL